jgi:acyl-CoA thioester hydrolase
MGVAHHSAYIVWLEAARVEWLRDRGLSYRQIEESGLSLAVSRIAVTYRAATFFDDELSISARLKEVRSRRVAYAYQLERAGLTVATAVTEHVPTDRSGRATVLPTELFSAMRSLLATNP